MQLLIITTSVCGNQLPN